jgi:metallo-beta-lactamase family protein
VFCDRSFSLPQFLLRPRKMDQSARFTISFLGAAETVTGSRYLVESDHSRVLVDCGLFQGYKKLRERNWAPPGFTAASVDAVVLTHAHLDHSGYLPCLLKAGFGGPIYCTPGTRDLLGILLPDAGHLQEEEAKFAARAGFSKHSTPLPLFTREEAMRCLDLVQVVAYDEELKVTSEVSARFSRAGHIVGSASLRLQLPGVSIGFSGDVGRARDPIMRPPAPLLDCDYLVLESTYGDRRHPPESSLTELANIVKETVAREGSVVVPAFAVGRAQHLLHLLSCLVRDGWIPRLPIYLDSPMAIEATGIFRDHPEEHALSAAECREMCTVAHCTSTADESRVIDASEGPLVVISASGMATGGRVLHHLKRFLPDARNTILLVGFQASGTRGRSLADGTDELKIHGQYVPVRAQIRKLDGLSAHADYAEMIEWLQNSHVHPRKVFVTHGEPAAADALRRRLRDQLGWDVVVPDHASCFPLPSR